MVILIQNFTKILSESKNLEVKQLKWEKNAEIELSDAEKEKGFHYRIF